MAKSFNMSGMNEVINNLNKAAKKVEGNSMKGIIEGAIDVRRAMDLEYPKIPVDTSNLRSSFFMVTSKGDTPRGKTAGFKGDEAAEISNNHTKTITRYKAEAMGSTQPLLIMGFSANYAFKVHENMEVNYKRPQSGAKFFETHLQNSEMKFINEIKKKTDL